MSGGEKSFACFLTQRCFLAPVSENLSSHLSKGKNAGGYNQKFFLSLFKPKNRGVDYPKNEKFTKYSKLTEQFERKKRHLLFYKQTPIENMLILFLAQTADAVRIISCLENGGKLRNEFPIEVIHAAAVHAVRLGISANGLALDIPFLEIRAVVLENGFETVVQK